MNKKIFQLLYCLLVFIIAGCSEKFPDKPHPNKPPETFISIFSDNELKPTISKLTIHWWGDDPDGVVIGYLYTFDQNAQNITEWDSTSPNSDWQFTKNNKETFTLKLTGLDTSYTIQVKAVDDLGVTDPTPAVQRYPVINSIPKVDFPIGTDVPETTFTVAHLVWSSSDPDGDDNIAKFEYVLDDTSNLNALTELNQNTKSITLTKEDGLTEGDHTFYLRVIDIAGAKSPFIKMPREENAVWYVREPKSNFLIVDDYNIANNTEIIYKSILDQLVGTYDIWDIKINNRALEPPSGKAFFETLLLFDRIFWFADAEPNFEKAQIGVPKFLEAGGKILMSTSFQEFASNQGDPLDFSPVDSLGKKISRITRRQVVAPVEPFLSAGFPELKVNTAIIPNVYPLIKKETASVLYQLPENASKWQGTPVMAVIDSENSFVFFGLPLANLDGNSTVKQVFEKILSEIF